MKNQTEGIVVSVKKQWWFKVNTKSFRTGPLDGAVFPHIIKVKYTVDGSEYTKRAWIGAGLPVPKVGSTVQIMYSAEKPSKAKLSK